MKLDISLCIYLSAEIITFNCTTLELRPLQIITVFSTVFILLCWFNILLNLCCYVTLLMWFCLHLGAWHHFRTEKSAATLCHVKIKTTLVWRIRYFWLFLKLVVIWFWHVLVSYSCFDRYIPAILELLLQNWGFIAGLYLGLLWMTHFFIHFRKKGIFRWAFHFYRAMLCIRGTSHGPVSVCVRLCLSQVRVLLKQLNVGSHKQHHTIAQGL